jgi:predicted RNase H-like nuclease (RuvC/YqgF family)
MPTPIANHEMDTEQELAHYVNATVEDLEKQQTKADLLDKKNKVLQEALKELKNDNEQLAGKLKLIETKKGTKSQHKQDLFACFAKLGQGLSEEYKKKNDAEAKEFEKYIRKEYLGYKE